MNSYEGKRLHVFSEVLHKAAGGGLASLPSPCGDAQCWYAANSVGTFYTSDVRLFAFLCCGWDDCSYATNSVKTFSTADDFFTFYSKRRRHEKMIHRDVLHLQYNNQHVTKTRWRSYDTDDGASRTCSYAICYCHCLCQCPAIASPRHADRWKEGEENEKWTPASRLFLPPL